MLSGMLLESIVTPKQPPCSGPGATCDIVSKPDKCLDASYMQWRTTIQKESGITGHGVHWPSLDRLMPCDGGHRLPETYKWVGTPLHESRQNALENATNLAAARERAFIVYLEDRPGLDREHEIPGHRRRLAALRAENPLKPCAKGVKYKRWV